MVSFYNYNPERKGSSFYDLYLIAIFVAFLIVFILVSLFYGVKFFIALVIKYYLWVFGVFAVIMIIRHYWKKGKRRANLCEYR